MPQQLTTGALDERDWLILQDRLAELDTIDGPRVGDWVVFADGVERRISQRWQFPADEDGPAIDAVQTSSGGSFYLGDGYVSFSGGLFGSVPTATLEATGQFREGRVWFFHHDHWTAHNGVQSVGLFRVFLCSEVAPR
jgi:hypothetical protein